MASSHSSARRAVQRVDGYLEQHTPTILMVLLLSALALSASYAASEHALWVDETITLLMLERWDIWGLLTRLPRRQPHFPTYYLFLEVFSPKLGYLLSAVSYPVTVTGTVLAARELHASRQRAYYAGVLIASAPFLATQATWLRMYAPLVALLSLVLWLGVAGRRRPAAVLALVACVLHPFAVFAAAWVAVLALSEREYARGVATAGLGVVPTLLLLSLKTTAGGAMTDSSTGVIHGVTPGVLHLAVTPLTALLGGPYFLSQVVLVLFLSAVVLLARPDWRLLAWTVLPLVGITVASLVLHPVFRPKYFGLVAPAVALMITVPDRPPVERYVIAITYSALWVMAWVIRAGGATITRQYDFLFL